MEAEQAPEWNAFAGVVGEKLVIGAEHECVADGDVNGGHVGDFVRECSEAFVNLAEEGPFLGLVGVLKLVHLDQKLVEADKADALRAAVVWEGVLLEGADQIEEAEAGRVGMDLAGLVSGPVVGFIGEYQIARHTSKMDYWIIGMVDCWADGAWAKRSL